jgi:hypothetical protein
MNEKTPPIEAYAFVTYTFKCRNGTLEVRTNHDGAWNTTSTLKEIGDDGADDREAWDAAIDGIEVMVAHMCDKCLIAQDMESMRDGQVFIGHMVLVIDASIDAAAENLLY